MGYFSPDCLTRQAQFIQSAMSDEEINYQLSMLYFPTDSVQRSPAVLPKESSSSRSDRSCGASSSASRSGDARCNLGSSSSGLQGVAKAEEDYLSALGIHLKPTVSDKKCGLCNKFKPLTDFISTKDCAHKYCTRCCKQNAELQICVSTTSQIECPHPSCGGHFDIDQCSSFLSEASFDILNVRLTEAAIPAAERVYCPFPDCSVFIPILKPHSRCDGKDAFNIECYSCHRGLCVECNIPWERECSMCAHRVHHTKFSGTKDCAHEFCTDCCKQHAEREISRGSSEIQCPHPSCGRNFDTDQCKTLLSEVGFDILNLRLKEAATPAAERVYCPLPDCSAFVCSKSEYCSANSANHTLVECHYSCHHSFCLECKVSWERECDICADTVPHNEFISTEDCDHETFCAECCKQYAETKISSGSLQIDCPHPDCGHNFGIEQCKALLSPESFDILNTRLTEAAIPADRKVFCPFQGCSVMMEKPDQSSATTSATRRHRAICYSCKRGFCLDCVVPWHENMTCGEYRADVENSKQDGDQKLRDLAKTNKWRECPNLNCRLVVERKSGCNHITCRCKTEFCYLCSCLWENKKATCSCKLFDR